MNEYIVFTFLNHHFKQTVKMMRFRINHKSQLATMREKAALWSSGARPVPSCFQILLLSFHTHECLLNMLLITDANGTERETENKYFKVISYSLNFVLWL